MRKLVALMLALVLCFGLTVGCKKGGSDNAEPAPPDNQLENTDNGGGDGGGESK